MRYHYQIGATKDKKGIGKGKIAFFVLIVLPILGYVGFLMALPSVGGWPLRGGEEVVNTVRSVEPGANGNKLYIPQVNVALDLDSRDVQREGEFGAGKSASISAVKFAFGVTPNHILEASPFYRLAELGVGDEFYVDYDGTRYAYRVSDEVTAESRLVLSTKDESVAVNAEPIGIVAWNGGQPRIEAQTPEVEPAAEEEIDPSSAAEMFVNDQL